MESALPVFGAQFGEKQDICILIGLILSTLFMFHATVKANYLTPISDHVISLL